MTSAGESAEDETPVSRQAAAPGSALSSLRDRQVAARKELHLDLAVQRLDPPVYVRFAPVGQGRVEAVTKRFDKSKDQDKTVLVNAAILAEACQGIFEVIGDGEVSIDPADREGDWPRFDDRLAGLLGADAGKASDVVRALYLTDGDVVATASKLADWSGYSLDDLEERAGN